MTIVHLHTREVAPSLPLWDSLLDHMEPTMQALFGLGARDILARRNDRQLSRPRYAATLALSRARLDLSLPQIGRIMRRDHTTIMARIRGAKSIEREDRDFAAAVAALHCAIGRRR